MAYPTRGRDPLLDSTTQAALEKRSKELIGIGLVIVALMFAAMLVSYSPDDPNLMVATDAPVQNWLGRFGASLAHPLFMIAGYATWAFPLMLGVWGLRIATHHGADRFLGRVIFAPIAAAVATIYAATLVTPEGWVHSFGLGGLFGDTMLGILLTVLPIGASIAVKIWSLITGLVMLLLGAYALGFTNREIYTGWRAFLLGLLVTYDFIMRLLGRGASAGIAAAKSAGQTMAERRATARAEVQTSADIAAAVDHASEQDTARVAAVVRANPVMPTSEEMAETPDYGEYAMPPGAYPSGQAPLVAPQREVPAAQGGLLSRMPSLLKRSEPRMPEPIVEPEAESTDAFGNDRIKSRISDAIRAREEAKNPPRVEPEVTRPKGPTPLVLNLSPAPTPLEAPVEDNLFEDIAGIEETPAAEEARVIERTPEEPTRIAQRDIPPAFVPKKPVVQPREVREVKPSARAKAEAQPTLPLEDKYKDYEFPPLNLLTSPDNVERHHLSDEALEENARMLESVLDDYGVKGEIVSVRPGPVVTMYELEPAPGLKASRVIGLSDDIARSMSALSARVSTVPGRSVIGIELPNEKREMVVLREMLAASDFGDSQMRLPLALGKDIGGQPIIANLAKMPHLLIAGTTGSGKSVAINTMILSLLYKLTPEECRLIMIDPKMLELSVYDGIPHLLSPVVTDPKKAVVALKWTVGEMEERYRKMSKMGVRNIEGYNGRVRDALDKGEQFERTVQTGFDDETGDPIFETESITPEAMPYIVVIVDEMADLMMVAGKEIEACIQRLAQMARASGIHLIMATQRPSVDVITGTIKANFPTRISFQVTSKIDSRTILGEMGAEQLLGMGDMLYMAGGGKISRIHGPFCSDEEVEEIVNHLKSFGPPEYMSGVVEGPSEEAESSIDQVLGLGGNTDGENALYDMAVQIVAKDRKCSTSYIQRKLAIGYNKAARLVEQMEDEGIVSSANHVGKREILVPEVH